MDARRGSLTVEAAIVLPIVLMMIFSLLMTTRIYYTYNKMDNAMTQAAYSISNVAYPLKEIGILDWQEGKDEAATELESVIGGSIEQLNEVALGTESQEVYKTISDNVRTAIFGSKGSIQAWIDSITLLKEQYDVMLKLVKGFKDVALDVLKAVRSQVGNVDGYVYSKAKQLVVRWYVDHYVRDYLGEDYMKSVLYIRSYNSSQAGMDNVKLVDYKTSNAFFTYSDEVTINNVITLNAEYYLDIPFPIPIGDIHMNNSVTLRGMAGN